MLSFAARTTTPRTLSGVVRNASSRRLFGTKDYLVVNAVGHDRPGIVSDITKVVTDSNANVGESRAVRLGGHFSMMMLVSVSSDEKDDLKSNLNNMKGLHLSHFDTTDPNSLEMNPKVAYKGRFTLSGADHPGIVHKVTSLLAGKGMTIDSLETSEEDAPFGGTTLFLMEGVVTMHYPLADKFDVNAIENELVELGESLNCDVSLENVYADGDANIASG